MISPGDVLGLTIFENVKDDPLLGNTGQRVSALTEIQVDGQGFIFVPYAGKIKAAGQSPDSLRSVITKKLDTQTPDPQVQVQRLAGDGSTVSIAGFAGAQGVYPIERPTRTLTSMIAKAGGIAIEPAVALVRVTRGNQTGKVWLQDLYENPGLDIALRGAAIALRRKFSASAFWKDVAHYQATSFGYIGELCRYLLNQPVTDHELNNSLTSMIGNGLRPAIWAEFKARFGIEQIAEFYASSEGNIAFTNVFNFDNTVGFTPATFAIVRYDLENDRPLRNAKGFLEKVKAGQPGLLVSEISKKFPFDGYTDPAKSEAVILRDVFKKGDAWFNTGDLMRDIGCKHAQFVDRLGDTFRWKGENVSTTEVESVLGAFPGVEDAVVYGVAINGSDGRCGMAALRLAADSTLDPQALAQYLDGELPVYAAPLFIRLLSELETTGTFKYKKNDLKQVAYNPAQTSDPLFVRLPGAKAFQPLDDELWARIEAGEFRF